MDVHGPAHLPLSAHGEETLHFDLWYYGTETGRWVAAVAGETGSPEPMPLRIESACVFGHVFGSRQCDCDFQLQEALRRILRNRRGMVVYGIDQDARGAGMAAHFDIYRFRQQDGLDTEAVFDRLGAAWDSRDYGPVLDILAHQGVKSVTLLSNNASRIQFLQDNGIAVTREPLEARIDVHNMSTLMLEKEDLGYRWTFHTHADNLEPLQAKVVATNRSAAALAAAGQLTWLDVVADDAWEVAAWLTRAVAERTERAAVAPDATDAADAAGAADVMDVMDVLYLTDLPRLHDLEGYAELGVKVIAVPFPVVGQPLTARGRRLGVKVVDWARRNAYREPRPQWELTHVGPAHHRYRRGDRVRHVRLSAGTDWPTEVARLAPTASGADWVEFGGAEQPGVRALIGLLGLVPVDSAEARVLLEG